MYITHGRVDTLILALPPLEIVSCHSQKINCKHLALPGSCDWIFKAGACKGLTTVLFGASKSQPVYQTGWSLVGLPVLFRLQDSPDLRMNS